MPMANLYAKDCTCGRNRTGLSTLVALWTVATNPKESDESRFNCSESLLRLFTTGDLKRQGSWAGNNKTKLAKKNTEMEETTTTNHLQGVEVRIMPV